MTEHHPVGARNKFLQRDLDFLRRLFRRQTKPPGQSPHVRIDDDALVDAERVAEHDVGRLAPHPGQGDERIHRRRHLAAVRLDEHAAAVLDALSLVAKQADPLDVLLQFLQRHCGVVSGPAIFFEQDRSDDVDLLVGALRGENRRDQQLERIAVVEFAMRIGIRRTQAADDFRRAFDLGLVGFARH